MHVQGINIFRITGFNRVHQNNTSAETKSTEVRKSSIVNFNFMLLYNFRLKYLH